MPSNLHYFLWCTYWDCVLDGIGQVSIVCCFSRSVSNQVSKVSTFVQGVNISHSVEEEVIRRDFLPQVTPFFKPMIFHPIQINFDKIPDLFWDEPLLSLQVQYKIILTYKVCIQSFTVKDSSVLG